jgi:hypothetical protein
VTTVDILYLIDQLEVLLSESWRLPLTTKVVVDEEEFLNIIDQLRVSIPAEVKKAKRIQQESQRLVIQGQEEADRIVSLARKQAEQLINEEDLRTEAEDRVQAIVDQAMEDANQIRDGANVYALDVLSDLEGRVVSIHGTLRNGISLLSRRQSSPPPDDIEEEADEPADD